jgi:hypothetical protein
VTEAVGGAETSLPRCTGANQPCWRIDTDEAACPAADHLTIAIDRGATTAPSSSRIQATCFAH